MRSSGARGLERRGLAAEFRERCIERPPVDDSTFDCVISNGVINLSPDKPTVFAAAARALRPGGRVALAGWVGRRSASPGAGCEYHRRCARDLAHPEVLPRDH